MKIVTPQEMARIEQLAYAEGADEEQFMETAGLGVAEVVEDFCQRRGCEAMVGLLCGKGNNAGDAYVAGRALLAQGYEVTAYQIGEISDCSPLCQKNHQRFIQAGGVMLDSSASLPATGLLLDGIFGTGFRGEAKGVFKELINAANGSGLPIIAIDIPSGLDGASGEAVVAIKAAETVFLGQPKLGFFLRQGHEHTGPLRAVNFGLETKYVERAQSAGNLVTRTAMKPLLPAILRSRHKYQAGFLLAVAGSPGMPGAAMLSCYAALRAGAGIVYLYHPAGMAAEFAGAAYELVRKEYSLHGLQEAAGRAQALIVGPGMGRDETAAGRLEEVLSGIQLPMVIDADALYLMAEKGLQPPAGAVLTPHIGELQRLLGLDQKPELDEELLAHCQAYASQHEVHLILKGGPTFIFDPGEAPSVCAVGDPGMASAGTGDVLTGVIGALLAQGCVARDAAKLGVYLHGLAGEATAEEMGSYSMIASDMIEQLPQAFQFLRS